MRKRKVILFGILMICFSVVLMYRLNLNSKLSNEERTELISIVNSYYDRIMSKNYEGALELVNLPKDNYGKELDAIKNNNEYKIEKRLDGNQWVVPMNGQYDYYYYDKGSKCFVVLTGVRTIKHNNPYEVTENVYVKRIGNGFKIVRISTDDRFGYIRGSFVVGAI